MSEPKFIGYAFWKYDLFPYWIGSEFTEHVGGRVKVPAYGNGATAMPCKTFDVATGRKIAKKLADLKNEHRLAEDKLKKKYIALVDAVFVAGAE